MSEIGRGGGEVEECSPARDGKEKSRVVSVTYAVGGHIYSISYIECTAAAVLVSAAQYIPPQGGVRA